MNYNVVKNKKKKRSNVFDSSTIVTANPFNKHNLTNNYTQSPQHVMVAKKDLSDIPTLTLPQGLSVGNADNAGNVDTHNSFNNPLNILRTNAIKDTSTNDSNMIIHNMTNDTALPMSSPPENTLSSKQKYNNKIFKNNITKENPILSIAVNNNISSNNTPLKSFIVK